MIDAVIYALISICVIVLVVYLVIWVLGQIGVPLPANVMRVIWVIVALLCVLVLWHLLSGVVHVPALR
jgi:hypothetical protein